MHLKTLKLAGRHLQDRDIYNDGSSPTLSTSSLFMLLATASKDKAVAAIDFPRALLNSMPEIPDVGDHVDLIGLNKFHTSVLVKIDPSYSTYVQKNGTCVVRFKKALYGCVESAGMRYRKLFSYLLFLGYKPNKLDMCVFVRFERDCFFVAAY